MVMIDKGNEWLEVYKDGSVWILRGRVNGINVMQPFKKRMDAMNKLNEWK
jgi:hypothetical protein